MAAFLSRLYYKWFHKYNPTYCWRIRDKAKNKRGILRYLHAHRWRAIVRKEGAVIPLSAHFEQMPTFPHGFFGIFISGGARIGSGCTIYQQVTIGSNTLKDTKKPGAPIIGNNVFIGTGAKIIGGVRVGNNVRIGANCVVVNDIPDNCTVVLPSPRVIPHTESKNNYYVRWGEQAGSENEPQAVTKAY